MVIVDVNTYILVREENDPVLNHLFQAFDR